MKLMKMLDRWSDLQPGVMSGFGARTCTAAQGSEETHGEGGVSQSRVEMLLAVKQLSAPWEEAAPAD